MVILKDNSNYGKVLNELEQWLKEHDLTLSCDYRMAVCFTFKDGTSVIQQDVETGETGLEFPRELDSERFVIAD